MAIKTQKHKGDPKIMSLSPENLWREQWLLQMEVIGLRESLELLKEGKLESNYVANTSDCIMIDSSGNYKFIPNALNKLKNQCPDLISNQEGIIYQTTPKGLTKIDIGEDFFGVRKYQKGNADLVETDLALRTIFQEKQRKNLISILSKESESDIVNSEINIHLQKLPIPTGTEVYISPLSFNYTDNQKMGLLDLEVRNMPLDTYKTLFFVFPIETEFIETN